MLPQPRLTAITLLLGAALLGGCVTEGDPQAGAPGFPWVTVSDVPDSRDDLQNPSRLDLRYAQWQEQSGNLPEAELAYKRVLEAEPESLDARLGLARLEQRAGHTIEAEQSLRKIVAEHPENSQALAALGLFFAGEQRWVEATAQLERAAKLSPDQPLYRQHYAAVLARSGDLPRAFAEFAKLHGEAEAHYNLACLHRAQGRNDLAEQRLHQALALRPELSQARQMLDDLRATGREQDAALASAAAPPAIVQAGSESMSSSDRVTPAACELPCWELPASTPR